MRALIVLVTVLLCGCGVTSPCAGESACTCAARSECRVVAEDCYCPTACNGAVCVCGGGAFLRCEDAPQ
ncbi:MAG: hypothetical protein ACO1OB_27375 [Archangium sp.]